MTSLDVKKLVAIFLLVASTVSSAALVFSVQRTAEQPVPSLAKRGVSENQAAQLGGNAFVERAPVLSFSPPQEADAPQPLPPASPGNITDNIADQLAQQIVRTNPEGPRTVNGESRIAVPPIDTLVRDALLTQKKTFRAPDWDKEIENTIFTVLQNPTNEDSARYASSLVEAINAVAAPNIGEALSADSTAAPETVALIKTALDQAIATAKKIPVPEPFLRLHRTIVGILIYERNAFALGDELADDPLRIALVLQTQEQGLNRLLASLDTYSQGPSRNGLNLVIAKLLGINTAHATAPVVDPAHISINVAGWIKQFATDAYNWLKKHWKEIIKQRIISRMVAQTITWIQGGFHGKPGFITDWKGFLLDAANVAAGDLLYELRPRLCQSFGPLVTASLLPVPLSARAVTCTLDQVVQNVQDFYDNFQNGGWVAYASTLEPQNNVFGAIYLSNLIISQKKHEAEEAAKNNALASQGGRPTQRCLKPFNKYRRCVDDVIEECSQAGPPDPNCIAGAETQCAGITPGEEGCDEWIDTTPGGSVAYLLNKSVGSDLDQFISAQDISAIINALINSVLTKLRGDRGVLGLTFPKDDASCDRFSGTQRIECECKAIGLTGKNLKTCVNETGNTSEPAPSMPTGTESGSKCGPDAEQIGCRCTGDGGVPGLPPNDLSNGDFDWRDKVVAAQDRVLAIATQECAAGGTNTKGLFCGDLRFTAASTTYVAAVAADITQNAGGGLRGGVVQGDEVGIADGTPPKSEHYDIVRGGTDIPTGADGGVWIGAISICSPPQI